MCDTNVCIDPELIKTLVEYLEVENIPWTTYGAASTSCAEMANTLPSTSGLDYPLASGRSQIIC